MGTVLEQLETIDHFRERAPVDVVGLIEALSLEYTESFLDPEISGMIEHLGGDEYLITVNNEDAETRKRFSAAHELGHYMLHRPKIGPGVDDDRLYRSTSKGKYHNTAIGRPEETEANRFAANLLMPQLLIEKHTGNEHITYDLAERLAIIFQVSVHAMCIRLGVPYVPSEYQPPPQAAGAA